MALRIVFAGSPEFAVPALEALADSLHSVVAAYTQPDRPAGRGRSLKASAIKRCAQALGIPVFQPVSLRDKAVQAELAALAPDLMVVVAYGLILPQAVLDIPGYGCINVHASLLPSWRGAAPIQRAILAGDQETGVTIMQMEAGLDTGPILLQLSCPIEGTDTAEVLERRLSRLGAEALLRVIPQIEGGMLKPRPQPEAGVSYAAKITKAEAQIDWRQPAIVLARQVRAFNPWPVALSPLNGKSVRIWRAQVQSATATGESPGRIVAGGASGIDVATGAGVLRILELQWPGGRVLTAAEAVSGRALCGQQFEAAA